MKKQDRWNEILNIIKIKKEVTVEELAREFNTSLATIRRDLLEMEENSMITRFHGGARYNTTRLSEPPMMLKSETNAHAKQMVGRYAASLIKDNQLVYIDAGSATYEMLGYITAKNITVCTVGIPHISKLLSLGINTIVPGGHVRPSTMAITGIKTARQVTQYYFDVCFIGSNGIHEQMGVTTTNEYEAEVKRAVITHSKKAYVLSDNTKFNVAYPCSYASLDEVTIITDSHTNYVGKPVPSIIETDKMALL